jgi:cytochrome P450
MSVRLDEIDLSSHDAFVDEVPLWAFRELRERDPVHWQPEPTPNRGFWAITRFHDIEEILRDPRSFSSAHGITLEEQTDEEVEARASMIDMDPPNHSRLRRFVTKLFTRGAVAQYEGFVREQARLVLDQGSAQGRVRFRRGDLAGAPDPRPRPDHGRPRRGSPDVRRARRRHDRPGRPRVLARP